MNILFITDNFPPEVNAPASRTFEHCREWVKAGHNVTVITGFPNFPTGNVYKGYQNRLWQTEIMDGIRVVRVWTFITANEGFFKRSMDYFSFMISSVIASLFIGKPSMVIGTSPQFFTVCAAYIISRFQKIPFVFELRDIWPESIKAVGIMKYPKLIEVLERIEMFLYQKAALIMSVTESFKKILVKRGIDSSKIRVVMNGADLSRFHPVPKNPQLVSRYGLTGKFVAGYVGTHGMAHALETILQAAHRIKASPYSDKFHFIFLGDGAKKQMLIKQAEDMGLDNITFIDSVPKSEVANYWSLLDVSIIHLKKTDLFTTVIPSKLFECVGMGIPILHGVAGESAEIVTKEGVGLTFEPENSDELCQRLIRLETDKSLLDQLRLQCVRSRVKFDRSSLASKMMEILTHFVM